MTKSDLIFSVRQLEQLLGKLREANAFLLDQDSWDRWGRQHASDQEIDERMARERMMIDQRDDSIRELTALSAASSRETLAAWADAHDRLLERFIADYATRDPSPHAVAVGVATTEREQWQAVKRGELPFVDGNVFFIQFDRALYAELFG